MSSWQRVNDAFLYCVNLAKLQLSIPGFSSIYSYGFGGTQGISTRVGMQSEAAATMLWSWVGGQLLLQFVQNDLLTHFIGGVAAGPTYNSKCSHRSFSSYFSESWAMEVSLCKWETVSSESHQVLEINVVRNRCRFWFVLVFSLSASIFPTCLSNLLTSRKVSLTIGTQNLPQPLTPAHLLTSPA